MKSKKKPLEIYKKLRTPKFRQKIVKAKKGKGSYDRNTENLAPAGWPKWFGSGS